MEFSVGYDQEQVFITLDREGLAYLQGHLRALEGGDSDHFHLMTAAWGLGGLSENPNLGQVVHHVKVMPLPP
jgi:hypothetical protein